MLSEKWILSLGDTETEMRRRIENMGHDDDWDEIHLPQAIEFHMKLTIHKYFKSSIFLLHNKVQGTECIKKAVDEYFLAI